MAPLIPEPAYKRAWRPLMAYLYALICLFDFVVAPATMIGVSTYTHKPYVAWVPLTLQNGGLLHASFGSILGIYAWRRSQEKLAGVEGNNAPENNSPPSTDMSTAANNCPQDATNSPRAN